MTQIWRINIKTDAREGVDPRTFCLTERVLGVGWPVDHPDESLDWDIYKQLAEVSYYDQGDKSWWPALNALKNRMQITFVGLEIGKESII